MANSVNEQVYTHTVMPAAREALRCLQGSEDQAQRTAGDTMHKRLLLKPSCEESFIPSGKEASPQMKG